MAHVTPNKRGIYLFIVVASLISISLIFTMRQQNQGVRNPFHSTVPLDDEYTMMPVSIPSHVVAPKLGNETAKAELGRAAWKLFHTTFARFPDSPTQEESMALQSYIHLFQKLYPCGECAEHFGVILKKFPPQVSSRSTAAAWGCHVHNEVNKSLKKELFDCSKIGDFYDCGCADDEDEQGGSGKVQKPTTKHRKRPQTDDSLEDSPLELTKEELQRGG